MSCLLTIDIGNTNITAGIFSGAKLIGKEKLPTYSYSSYIKRFKALIKSSGLKVSDIKDAIVSSVVPLALARIVAELHKMSAEMDIKIVGRDTKAPIRNMYRIKSEVGQDRLVNAFAAKVLYGAPAVIIDFGTAITFDIVSRRGEYLGGLILPGIELSLSSLYKNTALLPRVELESAPSIIGKDTVDSMRGGILFGFGAMCDGLVGQYRKMLGGNTKIIATGGNSRLMKRYTKSIQYVNEDLTLKGLLLIFKKVS